MVLCCLCVARAARMQCELRHGGSMKSDACSMAMGDERDAAVHIGVPVISVGSPVSSVKAQGLTTSL